MAQNIPKFGDSGRVLLVASRILARRLVRRGNSPATELLVQWSHLPESEAAWEDIEYVRLKFPHLLA